MVPPITRLRIPVALGILLTLLALPTGGQEAPLSSSDDRAAVKRVEGMISAAMRTLRTEAGGNPAASEDLRRQALELWQYGRAHSGERSGAKATAGAIRLLVAMELDAEALQKVDLVGSSDPAWEWLLDILLDQAARRGSYEYLVQKAQASLPSVTDPLQRSRFQLALGLALERAGRQRDAEAAFQKVLEERPGSRHAEVASGHIHELRSLGVGQNAPPFTATSNMTGEKVALGALRGKIVLLDIWASY